MELSSARVDPAPAAAPPLGVRGSNSATSPALLLLASCASCAPFLRGPNPRNL